MKPDHLHDQPPARLDERLAHWAGARPDRPALRVPGTSLSHGELWTAVQRTARELQALGAAPGRVVAFQLPNLLEALVLYYAVVRVGAVALPILPAMREHDVVYMLAEARPVVFATLDAWRGRPYAEPALALCTRETRVVRVEALAGEAPMLTALGTGRRDSPAQGAAPASFAAPDDPLDAVAGMIFTSGTSGRPKAVLYSHRNLAVEGREMARLDRLGPDDVLFVPSSIAHVSGICFALYMPAYAGCCVCLQPEWDARAAIDYIREQRCTWVSGATPFLQGLVEAGRGDPAALASVKIYRCGGASVPPGLVRQARAFGIDAYRCYGLSEHPTISGAAGQPDEVCIDTDGQVHPHVQVRVVDPADATRSLPPGVPGEIAVRGPDQSLGYLRAEDTAALRVDGWLLTGDIGTLSPRGVLTITGRKKDIIIRKGENISPKEIEDILIEHPGVRDVAVIGLPDAERGELACCVIVPAQSPPPSLQEVCAHLRQAGLTVFKLPERLVCVDALPYNPSGKVLKTVLKARLLDESAASAA